MTPWLVALLLPLTGARASTVAPDASLVAEEEEEAQPDGIDWFVAPVAKFNDDIGFMYGGHLALVEHAGGADPFAWFFEIKLRHSTKNRHEHWLYFDTPRFFGLRFRTVAEVLHVSDANYFGVARTETLEETGSKTFNYQLTEPRVQTYLFDEIGGDFFWGVGLTVHYTRTEYGEETLIAKERPPGVDGGHGVIGLVALSYDSRDDELRPHNGIFAEAYAKAATRPLGSSMSYQGVGLVARGYYELLPELVVAVRLMAEDLGGDVPFYEMARIGGSRSVFGLGGVFSQRGVAESRYIGRTKLLSNVELRYYFPQLFGLVSIGLGAFADASLVTDGAAFSELPGRVRPSGGGEITVKWKDVVIVRFDLGFSEEETNFYVEGRHLF